MITLNITNDEAKALVAILNRVGGSRTNSPRKHADSLLHRLEDAHVPDTNYDCIFLARNLYFKDFDESH